MPAGEEEQKEENINRCASMVKLSIGNLDRRPVYLTYRIHAESLQDAGPPESSTPSSARLFHTITTNPCKVSISRSSLLTPEKEFQPPGLTWEAFCSAPDIHFTADKRDFSCATCNRFTSTSNLRTTSFDLRKRLHKKITTPISDVVVKDAGDEGSDRAAGEGASFFE